jgi:hypothetical protein
MSVAICMCAKTMSISLYYLKKDAYFRP